MTIRQRSFSFRNVLVAMLVGALLLTGLVIPSNARAEAAPCQPTDTSDAQFATCLLYPVGENTLQYPGYVRQLGKIDLLLSDPRTERMINEQGGGGFTDISGDQFDHWRRVFGVERLRLMLQYQAHIQAALAEMYRYLDEAAKTQPNLVKAYARWVKQPFGRTELIKEFLGEKAVVRNVTAYRTDKNGTVSYPATALTFGTEFLSYLPGPFPSGGDAVRLQSPSGSWMPVNLGNRNFERWDPELFDFDPVMGLITPEDNQKISRSRKVWNQVVTKVVPLVLGFLLTKISAGLFMAWGLPEWAATVLANWATGQIRNYQRTGELDFKWALRQLLVAGVSGYAQKEIFDAGWVLTAQESRELAIEMRLRVILADSGMAGLQSVIMGDSFKDAFKAQALQSFKDQLSGVVAVVRGAAEAKVRQALGPFASLAILFARRAMGERVNQTALARELLNGLLGMRTGNQRKIVDANGTPLPSVVNRELPVAQQRAQFAAALAGSGMAEAEATEIAASYQPQVGE